MQLEPERDNNGSDEFLPFLLADKKCALPDRSGLYLLLRDDNLGFLALHEASDEIKLEDKIQLISMCMLLCSEVWYSAVGPISDDFLRQFEWLEQLPSKIKLHSVNQGPEAMGTMFNYLQCDVMMLWYRKIIAWYNAENGDTGARI